MNKICTTIEQSKKLIELGIDVNTADVFCADVFDKEKETHSYNFHILSTWGCNTFEELKNRENKFVCFIPVWSLSALLDVLNKTARLIDEDASVDLSSYKTIEWYLGINNSDEEFVIESNPVDACVEMIIKLKEKNLL